MAFKMTGFSPFNKGIAEDLTMEEELAKEKKDKSIKDEFHFKNAPDPDREDGGYESPLKLEVAASANPKNTPYEEETGGGSYE